ncbi:MAG: PilN domain-containing protein [Cellvibrionaceae bacterium]|nr:PilN domain-containing protein [Cellvibrionaceae bacterium]
MARINLLPWREEYRQEKKKEFLTQLGAVCVLAVIVAFGWIRYVDGSIENQNQRNQILQNEIAVLDKRVQEINELKKKRQQLIARMKVIQDLQGTRPTIVRYFDEIVRAVPDGLFFTNLTRQGGLVSVKGVTESSNRVSSFMRNLDQSEWFANPNLKSITASSRYGEQASEFSLQFNAVLPASEQPEGGA